MMTAREQTILEKLCASRLPYAPRYEFVETPDARIYLAYGPQHRFSNVLIGFWAMEGVAHGPFESKPGATHETFRDAIKAHALGLINLMRPRGVVREGRVLPNG